MAETSIRWAAAQRLLARLGDEPGMSSVQIEPGYPGEKKLKPQAVWLDEIFGDQDLANIRAGRRDRNDVFSLPLEMRVAGQGSLQNTMDRLWDLVAAVENVLADDSNWDDLDGIISVALTSERMTSGETPDSGVIGFAEAVVSITARYE